MVHEQREQSVPIVEEQVHVDKRVVQTGVVRISTAVDEHTQWVRQELVREDVTIERVPINRVVEKVPEIRQEAEVLIIPVFEEQLVVETRCVLKEELHVRKRRHTETVEIPVALRSSAVSVERESAEGERRAGVHPEPT